MNSGMTLSGGFGFAEPFEVLLAEPVLSAVEGLVEMTTL